MAVHSRKAKAASEPLVFPVDDSVSLQVSPAGGSTHGALIEAIPSALDASSASVIVSPEHVIGMFTTAVAATGLSVGELQGIAFDAGVVSSPEAVSGRLKVRKSSRVGRPTGDIVPYVVTDSFGDSLEIAPIGSSGGSVLFRFMPADGSPVDVVVAPALLIMLFTMVHRSMNYREEELRELAVRSGNVPVVPVRASRAQRRATAKGAKRGGLISGGMGGMLGTASTGTAFSAQVTAVPSTFGR
jgi:hypothetical protein